MKVKRLISTVFVAVLLLSFFVIGAYAVDEPVDISAYQSIVTDQFISLQEDQLYDVGDFYRYESEPNDSITNYDDLDNDLTMYGALEWADKDFFRLNIKGTSSIVLMAGADAKGLTFDLMDAEGNILLSSDYTDYIDSVYLDGLSAVVSPGIYYVAVSDPSYSYYYESYYSPISYLMYFCIDSYLDYGNGQIGDDAYWKVTTDNVLHIFGNGATYDLKDWKEQPWDNDYVSSLIVEDGITYIGSKMFNYCGIKSVDIAESVAEIGESAFSHCGVTDVVLTANNLAIGKDAFSYCSNLNSFSATGNSISFADSVFSRDSKLVSFSVDADNISFGSSCFIFCYKLDSVEIIGNVTQLGNGMFSSCTSIKNIDISGSFDSIPITVFRDCKKLETVVIDASVNHIGASSFNSCVALTSVYISGENVVIDKEAFTGCTKLQEINVIDKASSIGVKAFADCSSLKTLAFSKELNSIGKKAFSGCVGVSKIIANGDAPSIGDGAFTGVVANVYYPADNTTYTEDMMLDYGGDLTWVAHTHNYEETVVTEAFDTTDGEILYQCPDCGHEYTVIVPAPNPFDDVILGKFYYNPVMWALENNITKGITDSTFEPDTGCSRGQVVTFLWRAAGCPEPTSTEHNFTDVRKGAYYYKAMLWAVEQGITVGTTKTTFAPDDTCTRGQVVTFLWRAAGSPAAENREHSFTDVRENGYYFKAMLWAVENGITKGTTKTEFAPDDTCNRGQVVTFLYRQYA